MANANPPDPSSLRLFFALWPDDATRDALNRTGKWLHQHWGGRRMRADTLHVTLAFLGATPADQLDRLIACAQEARGASFELVLDQPGHWRQNRVGWLGPREIPQPYLELVGALNGSLATAGFPVDPRPHVPHVTLLRNSDGGEVLSITPVCWPVRDFVLVKSVTESDGAHYEVIARWPLA